MRRAPRRSASLSADSDPGPSGELSLWRGSHAVFLAFLTVAVWQSYDAARANVAEEASALATLYRASTGMDLRAGTELRRLLRAYTGAVIEDEWAIQAETEGASPGLGPQA